MTSAPRRLHWVDALALATVVLGIAASVIGYRALRASQPKIDAVEPAVIRPASATRVRLRGRDLRPFLQVFIVKAGVPFVLHDQSSGFQPATFFLASAREAEIESPALGAGVYDLYLYDQGQRVAMVSAALRVESEARQPVTLTATVRFVVPNEMISLIRPGDRDRQASAPTETGAAQVRETTLRRSLVETVDFRQVDRRVFAGPKVFNRAIDATMAVPVTRDDAGVWRYRGAPVRAGEDFRFETARYVVSGTTLDVDTPK